MQAAIAAIGPEVIGGGVVAATGVSQQHLGGVALDRPYI